MLPPFSKNEIRGVGCPPEGRPGHYFGRTFHGWRDLFDFKFVSYGSREDFELQLKK
jgi:hypothetical protein